MLNLTKITEWNFASDNWYKETILVRCEVETDIAAVGEIGIISQATYTGKWHLKFVRGGEGLKFFTIVALLKLELHEKKYSFYHFELKP